MKLQKLEVLYTMTIACHLYAAPTYIQTPFEQSSNTELPQSKQVDIV